MNKSTSAQVNITAASPLVSVIIANYNYGRFLAEAIESVFIQTYHNFELIVVDDGSTDNSRDIIEFYGDRLITILQDNAGQGGAFNAGIARAKGEIICFLDSDDYFHREKLAKVVLSFQNHPEWVQISHYWISVNREGLPIHRSSTHTLNQGDVRNFLLKRGKYEWARTSGLAYRREALQKVLPVTTQRFEPVDAYLTATVPFYGKVGRINESLMFYRIHDKNMSARTADLSYLIHLHESIANYVNETAAKVGLKERFDIQKDADYRIFKVLQAGRVYWTEVLQVIWLTLHETISMRCNIKESLARLLWGCICILSPSEGRTVLRFGLHSYLHFKVLGTELES